MCNLFFNVPRRPEYSQTKGSPPTQIAGHETSKIPMAMNYDLERAETKVVDVSSVVLSERKKKGKEKTHWKAKPSPVGNFLATT